MNKVKKPGNKHSLVALLSIVSLIVGIGCISWSIFNIWTQSDYSGKYSIPVNFDAELKELTGDSTTLDKSNTSHVLSKLDKNLYPMSPNVGETIGTLTIPALKRRMPIIQGTGVKELKKGVGHFTQSVLPGEIDNCVISGHRDTVFRQIGNLKKGDQVIVQTSAGTFIYEVEVTRIVHDDDKTVIVPTNHATLTMTTCYPFNFIGSTTERYIVSAILLKSIKV